MFFKVVGVDTVEVERRREVVIDAPDEQSAREKAKAMGIELYGGIVTPLGQKHLVLSSHGIGNAILTLGQILAFLSCVASIVAIIVKLTDSQLVLPVTWIWMLSSSVVFIQSAALFVVFGRSTRIMPE